jgi:hypothetical protein
MNIKKVITSSAVLSVMAFSAAPSAKQIVPVFQPTAITASAARTVTYADVDNFFKKYDGVGIDVDGCYGVQCVDLVSKYIDEVCGISNTTLMGYGYWTQFESYSFLYNNFNKIANTPDLVPQKGDIVVWAENGRNHVGIATGEGTTSYFYSYEQNWNSNNDPTAKRYNNYSGVSGVLRYKWMSGSTVDPQPSNGAEFGTLWINNDTYIFKNTQTIYSDSSCKKGVGTISSGQKKKFVKFTKSGKDVIGRTSDGYYIKVKTNNVLNVNAYGTVNCDTLNVRKGAGTSYGIVKTVSYGENYLFTKTSGDWAYAPAAGGWMSLEYIKG